MSNTKEKNVSTEPGRRQQTKAVSSTWGSGRACILLRRKKKMDKLFIVYLPWRVPVWRTHTVERRRRWMHLETSDEPCSNTLEKKNRSSIFHRILSIYLKRYTFAHQESDGSTEDVQTMHIRYKRRARIRQVTSRTECLWVHFQVVRPVDRNGSSIVDITDGSKTHQRTYTKRDTLW